MSDNLDSGLNRKSAAALQKAATHDFLFQQSQGFEKTRDETADLDENSDDYEIYFPDRADKLIEQLPITICDESKDDSCGLCDEIFSLGDEMLTLPCKHVFHKGCIRSVLPYKETCPRCGEKVQEAGYTVPGTSSIAQSGEEEIIIEKSPVAKCDELKHEPCTSMEYLEERKNEEAIELKRENSKRIFITLPVTICDELKEEPCFICKKKYLLGDEIYTLPCKHEFHTRHATQYRNTCPICTGQIYDPVPNVSMSLFEDFENKAKFNADFSKTKFSDCVNTLEYIKL